MQLLSAHELNQLTPALQSARRTLYLPHLNAALAEFDITNFARLTAFLAQLLHESGSFRYFEEIASGAAYEGRADLGNTQPGDGRRFKGRGPIQLTGRANYRRYGQLLSLDLERHPYLAAIPEVGFRIAGLYWKSNGLNATADRLSNKQGREEERIFKAITKRINGGLNGLVGRLQHYYRAKLVLRNHVFQSPFT